MSAAQESDFLLKVKLVEAMFSEAASIERMLPDKEKKRLEAKASWPDYLYDQDDRKDQEPEKVRLRPSARQIDLYIMVCQWLKLLGMRTDKRIVTGKRIVWARANGFGYRDIAMISGTPPMTCQRWYTQDIRIIAKKVQIV